MDGGENSPALGGSLVDPSLEIQSLSKNNLNGILLEFIEAFIHQLLYIRKIYPADIFERRRKYGLPISMSRHPDLNNYIYQMLRHTAPLLDEGLAEKIVICFLDPAQKPLERYVVDLQDIVVSIPQLNQLIIEEAEVLEELEDQLRASLIKLNFVDSDLPSIPEDTTFTTFVYTREFSEATVEEREKKQGSRIRRDSLHTDLIQSLLGRTYSIHESTHSK